MVLISNFPNHFIISKVLPLLDKKTLISCKLLIPGMIFPSCFEGSCAVWERQLKLKKERTDLEGGKNMMSPRPSFLSLMAALAHQHSKICSFPFSFGRIQHFMVLKISLLALKGLWYSYLLLFRWVG